MAIKNNLPEFTRGSTWSPLREVSRLQRNMDRIFEDFLSPFQGSARSMDEFTQLTPPCDIEDTESHFLISMDVPGVSKDDMRIEMRDNQLVITGEKKQEDRHEEGRRLSSERYYGMFQRAFTLPASVDPEKVEASFQNGVLQIAIPKTAEAMPKTIEIKERAASSSQKSIKNEKGSKSDRVA